MLSNYKLFELKYTEEYKGSREWPGGEAYRHRSVGNATLIKMYGKKPQTHLTNKYHIH